MWIFDSPKNYSEMVEKIAKSTFVISLFLLYFLTCVNDEFNTFMKQISFNVEYEFIGIKLNLALLYFPLVISISEHIFKIHDKLSTILGIRSRYDKNIIAAKILDICKIKRNIEKLNSSEVQMILSKAFYKYASSTNPVIDQHYVNLAINEWCWYWIALDTSVLFLVIGILFLIIKWSLLNLLVVSAILAFLLLTMKLIQLQAKVYTIDEIEAICSDKGRKDEIKKELTDALSCK